MGIVRFMFAREFFLLLEPKSIDIHEIPRTTESNSYRKADITGVQCVYKIITRNKIPQNLLPTEILNYPVLQKSVKFYTLENFTYTVYILHTYKVLY